MPSGADVALARISEVAYLNQPNGLAAGFYPVTQAALGISLSAEELYQNGVYANRNGAALVLVGTLKGVSTAVLAFRGSDDREDSINDLQNINREFQLFPNLIAAFDAFVAREGITQVAVTGHSLGGAMDQLYMANHANSANVQYLADTFGSPGAGIAPGTDARITNLRVADDPAVFLGEDRAEGGSPLRSNPSQAAAAAYVGPEVFPGLTSTDVIGSIGSLDTNYVNRGTNVLLPNADGSLTTVNSLEDAASAGKSEHLIQTYLDRLGAVTGSTGDDQAGASITPTTVGVQVFRFFDSHNGTHFYTESADEKQTVQATRPDLVFEGVGLNALDPVKNPNAAPVFRFFDTSTGSHFYTASATEKQTIQASRPDLLFEGTAFYENTTPQAGNTAVYRFSIGTMARFSLPRANPS